MNDMYKRIFIVLVIWILTGSCDRVVKFHKVERLTEMDGKESIKEIVIMENAPLKKALMKNEIKNYQKKHERLRQYRMHYRLYVKRLDPEYSDVNNKYSLCGVYWYTDKSGMDHEDYVFYEDRWHL